MHTFFFIIQCVKACSIPYPHQLPTRGDNTVSQLCNDMGMVVLHAFHSCWKLLAFNQIQLDAYCAVVWKQFEAIFKLRPVIPIFERNEMTKCPRKPWQPTSIGITWHIQPFSTQSVRSVSYQFSFCLCASSQFFFPVDSQFYEEDTLLWIGPYYNVQPLFCLNDVS